MAKAFNDVFAKLKNIQYDTAIQKDRERREIIKGFFKKFHALSETAKQITWNRGWGTKAIVGYNSWFKEIIINPDWRAILPHGEIQAARAPKSDRVLIIGTHFGPVVLQLSNANTFRYVVTRAFANAWNETFEDKIPVDFCENVSVGYIESMIWFLTDDFLELVDEMRDTVIARGGLVGDGLPAPQPIVRVKKPEPATKAKHAQHKPQPKQAAVARPVAPKKIEVSIPKERFREGAFVE